MNKYLLDTNVFNDVLDGNPHGSKLAGLHLVGTFVQKREIEATGDTRRRDDLLRLFTEFVAEMDWPYTTQWGSPWGSRWSANDGLHEKMLNDLQARDKNKKKKLQNQINDVLMAETAIKSGLVFLTGDKNLKEVTIKFGGAALTLEEL